MKVLLTGASGFIGRHVLNALLHKGIQVISVGRSRPDAGGGFIEVDLLKSHDFHPLLNEVKATHLLHLAWYAEHGKYWTSPLNLRWTEATMRLTEAFCATGGKHVVIAGTCAEYDWSCGYCREDSTPAKPSTLYGIAKDATRRLAMAVCSQHGVTCTWGRVFLPFGPGEPQARLIPSLRAVFQGRREPFGVNGDAYRDFLHVEDVAEAFSVLLRHSAPGVYNISSGQPVLLGDIVRVLATTFGGDPQNVLRLASDRTGDPVFFLGDNAKLKALGWANRFSTIEYLSSCNC